MSPARSTRSQRQLRVPAASSLERGLTAPPDRAHRDRRTLEEVVGGLVDDLRRAREDYERGDLGGRDHGWSVPDPTPWAPPSDGRRRRRRSCSATATPALDLRPRAMPTPRRGRLGRRVRCAFYLAMRVGTGGDQAQARAWAGRGQRLIEERTRTRRARLLRVPADVRPHHGRRLSPVRGVLADAADDLGREHGDPELLALGLCGAGRVGCTRGGCRTRWWRSTRRC